jgi:RING finger protein 121
MAKDPAMGTNGTLALLNTTLNATLDAIQRRIADISRQETVFFGRELTDEELLAIQKRVAFEFEHRGHESEHSKMALILLGSLFVSQIAISGWKRRSPRTYNTATLLGLWLVPFFLGLRSGHWRFVIVHISFSIANGWIVFKALESPLRSWVPKAVYSWYAWVYAVSYSVGAIGYFIILLAFFHVPAMITGATIESEAHIFEVCLYA